jgi:hypothetical protein
MNRRLIGNQHPFESEFLDARVQKSREERGHCALLFSNGRDALWINIGSAGQ